MPSALALREDRLRAKSWAALPVLRLVAAAALALSLALALQQPARAQDYPSRPVTILIPLAAGGAMDIIAHSMAPKLAERLGKSVLVEERVGAGTVLAGNAVAHGPAEDR